MLNTGNVRKRKLHTFFLECLQGEGESLGSRKQMVLQHWKASFICKLDASFVFLLGKSSTLGKEEKGNGPLVVEEISQRSGNLA